eukprot:PhF_6_TR1452/c0_g1_i1/m.2597
MLLRIDTNSIPDYYHRMPQVMTPVIKQWFDTTPPTNIGHDRKYVYYVCLPLGTTKGSWLMQFDTPHTTLIAEEVSSLDDIEVFDVTDCHQNESLQEEDRKAVATQYSEEMWDDVVAKVRAKVVENFRRRLQEEVRKAIEKLNT